MNEKFVEPIYEECGEGGRGMGKTPPPFHSVLEYCTAVKWVERIKPCLGACLLSHNDKEELSEMVIRIWAYEKEHGISGVQSEK